MGVAADLRDVCISCTRVLKDTEHREEKRARVGLQKRQG